MTEPLLVELGGFIAGTITRLPAGRLRFEYDEAYRTRPGATPLSVSMPVQIKSHSDQTISPWLWGLLPDNDAVLTRWARQFQASASSAFSMLSTPIGRDCAGAVRFIRFDETDTPLSQPGEITWLTDDDVAQRLRDLKEDSTAWLGRSFTGQFSLSGAQTKTALLHRNGKWGVPHGATPTTHILKPAIAGFHDHDLNEHLCLAAARRVGILAARTQLARFGDQSAVIVERYDRRINGLEIIRVHQEDVCQALSVPPSRKYQNEGGPGPRDIAGLLRRVMPPSAADTAILRFADALIWNWVIAGTDAHAKNYSLLLAGDQIRLAPLYDVSSALPYGTHEKELRLAMKIGGDYSVFPARSTWSAAAKELGLPADQVIGRVRELTERAPDAMADAAKSADVTALGEALPGKLVDLISGRAKRCLRVLS